VNRQRSIFASTLSARRRRCSDTWLRPGATGIIVPTAAHPGTENLVLFGPRLIFDYLGTPISDEDVPTGHLTADARPPSEVVAMVRWSGVAHRSLIQWQQTGAYTVLEDPPAPR
jgi:hypothetical protein